MKPDLYEQGLLNGLAEGDNRTIEIIYKDHYNMIQSLIINNNGSADDAKDIFQEALIVLYEKVRSGSFELNCQLQVIALHLAIPVHRIDYDFTSTCILHSP